MKKDVPFIIKVKVPHDPQSLEGLLLFRFRKIVEEGYTFSKNDFNLYCAILIRKVGLEKLSESFLKYIILNNSIKPEIQFHKTALAIELEESVSDEDMRVHVKTIMKRAIERKKVIKVEIQRTGINPNKITFENSQYYRELLKITKEFDDLTLMDWFVPVVLKFERLVHIYIKHVEETKFGDGQFKARSFFDYKHTEIITLIKKIIQQEEQNIKEHFLEVAEGYELKDSSKIKDYHRGFRKFPPILLGTEKFGLTIDKHGFIQKFYQIKEILPIKKIKTFD